MLVSPLWSAATESVLFACSVLPLMLTPQDFHIQTATVALSPIEPETLAEAAVIWASVLRSALRSSVSAVVMAEFVTATQSSASLLPEEAVTPEASVLSTPVSVL